ncbi:hypothetical protein PI125_g12477 [Phytophthora idaei]|nr:hypothetical protein PI125_g12477 [Phytophthora idaei]
MKGSTGIQLHNSYVKPGCKVRGGKARSGLLQWRGHAISLRAFGQRTLRETQYLQHNVCQLPEEETPSGPSRASPGVSKKFFGQESFRPVKESRSSF